MSDAKLERLAEAAGLLVEWRDYSDRPKTVSPETQRAVLAAMDVPANGDGEIADSLERLSQVATPGYLTGEAGRTIATADSGRARLTLEDGETRDVDPTGFVVDQPGYHRLALGDREIGLAIAPRRAPGIADLTRRPKAWAIAVQLYSLRGRSAAGFGDFRALAEFAGTAADAGADAIAISPVHALFTADPARFSPYAPSSRDFVNPLYADPALLGGDGGEPDGGDLVDWPVAARSRLTRLRAAFDRFDGDERFERFVVEGGDALRSHALFEAIDNHVFANGGGSGWQAWPKALRDPGRPAVAAFATEHEDDVRFRLFLQWLAEESLARAQAQSREAGMAIGIISDMAVGIDPGGSHAWSRPSELIRGLTIGAPPDMFQTEGQGWGITGFSPIALAELGFEPYLRTLRAALRHAGGVRIDHALGLRRLWVIPDGAKPLDGVYLRYPLDDLLRLLALEAHRANAIVVGEDLGTVPEGLRERLAGHHLLGMSILNFERTDDGSYADPAGWRPVAAAMTSTHDMPPVAGWWRGRDLEWRRDLGIEVESEADRAKDRTALWDRAVRSGCAAGDEPPPDAPDAALDAAIGIVASAASELAIVPVEDMAGLVEAPNIPGTTDEHPNWRRRLADDADTLFGAPAVRRRADILNEARR